MLIQIKTAVTSRWYQLGEALGIDKESLDRYSSHPPEDSIVEMLDQWLRNGPEKRTWRDVADALRKINLHQLALDIEKIYETGKSLDWTHSIVSITRIKYVRQINAVSVVQWNLSIKDLN